MIRWFLLVLFGRLTIYLIQKFPLPSFMGKSNAIKEWHSCILCMGVWVYTLLAIIFRVDLLGVWFGEIGIRYIPLVSEFFTGAITSWLFYIFEIGYKERYLNITIVE